MILMLQHLPHHIPLRGILRKAGAVPDGISVLSNNKIPGSLRYRTAFQCLDNLFHRNIDHHHGGPTIEFAHPDPGQNQSGIVAGGVVHPIHLQSPQLGGTRLKILPKLQIIAFIPKNGVKKQLRRKGSGRSIHQRILGIIGENAVDKIAGDVLVLLQNAGNPPSLGFLFQGCLGVRDEILFDQPIRQKTHGHCIGRNQKAVDIVGGIG